MSLPFILFYTQCGILSRFVDFCIMEVFFLLTKAPKHIFEPNEFACGQAVLAMLFDLDVFDVIKELKNERETTLKEMLGFVKNRGKSGRFKKGLFESVWR